ncbi:hypothetical protein [Aeromicrobium sp. CTD01-1L150]|uniref:hypothetical protein n=1 Tax=Aeromicrobium sp. CTD01-1L150 TaxID=3341830 RepID=UPI0035C079B0
MSSIVIVTRFMAAEPRYVARLLRASLRCALQARSSAGIRRVHLYAESASVYWTLTEWEHGRDAVAFRDSGAHADVMGELAEWASEAAFVHWQHHGQAPPRLIDVAQHADRAVFSAVDRPTPAHAAGELGLPRRARLRLAVPLVGRSEVAA